MNRLRSHKFKLNASTTATTTAEVEADNNNVNNNNNNEGQSSGLLNKISKRYSTLSNKIIRRSGGTIARKSQSPTKAISGSYDMTGANSEDHRLEIGAPVLISTTTLDADRFGVTAERLKQINGGIAANTNMIAVVDDKPDPTQPMSQQATPSSGSEPEMFVDALSSTPPIVTSTGNCVTPEEDDKFEMAFGTPATVSKECTPFKQNAVNPLVKYYETAKANRIKSKMANRQHSKSAQNLHKSELKVFLQKAPSMDLNVSLTSASLEHCEDLPRLPELYGASKCSLAETTTAELPEDNKEMMHSPPCINNLNSKSEPNTPVCPQQKVTGYLSQQQQERFKSVDSLDLHRNNSYKKRRSITFSSTTSINQADSSGSKNSLTSNTSAIENFNLKSVSCQSLNALNTQSLFVSIDELNEITRQINESEEFNGEIDLEYCNHRDQLKPNERRITLLKNKNSRLINFHQNKEKLKKSWTGVKHWIGEESTKFKDVVHRQKMAGSRLNLSFSDKRKSPSLSRDELRERTDNDTTYNSSAFMQISSSSPKQKTLDSSCDDIAEESQTDGQTTVGSPKAGSGDDDTLPLTKEEGQNGFEELRRYIKQGGDFGKELILILQERVESELLYSKSLSKMANKLNKASRELPGTIAETWRGVAAEMESRSDIHRQLSASLTDEIVKPLKNIVEIHHKTRKTVENNVDKAARVLSEWRVSEAKAKKSSHQAARENEKLQDAMLDVRIQKSPSIAMLHQGPNKLAAEKEIKSAEKDCAKLDNKRKKAEEAVKRADVEYYTLCVRAERARVDWEMAVVRGATLLQNIENQRLVNMKNFVSNYVRLTADMNPIIDGLVQRLQPQVDACNVIKDMLVVQNIRRSSEGPSEQLLPDFYCEHTTLAMNRERRKHALIKLLQLVKADLERERRSRNGLKGLTQSLSTQEHQSITDKLYHIRSMLTYLEGARFKLHSALLELDHKPRSSHPLAQHIQITRDRTGLQQSVLKVPLWLKNNDKLSQSNNGDETSSMRDNDYDCSASQITTSAVAASNISCADLSNKDLLTKGFNRSKSNIETFSTTTLIGPLPVEKNKTLSSSNNDDSYSDRGQADGGSNQQDSDFDEFSSQDGDDEDEQQSRTSGRREHKALIEKSTALAANATAKTIKSSSVAYSETDHHHHYQNSKELQMEISKMGTTNGVEVGAVTAVILSRCKALYSYTPKLYDELELNPGDIIEVHAKQEDGWWLGALGNQVGIFPATYVEEFA